MPNVSLLELSMDVPDQLGDRSAELDVSAMFRASFSIAGGPGDVVTLFGTDGSGNTGPEHEFGLGVLEYGDVITIGPETGVQTISCARTAGRNSGSRVIINGSSFLDGNAGAITARRSLNNPSVPDLPQTPSDWVDIADGVAYKTIGFQARQFAADDEVLIEATDSTESTICVLGRLKGVSDQFNATGDYPKVRARRVAGLPSDARIAIVGVPYGPTIGTPPLPVAALAGLASVNGDGTTNSLYNMDGAAKIGVGVTDVYLTFGGVSPIDHPMVAFVTPVGGAYITSVANYTLNSGAFRVFTYDADGTPVDVPFNFSCYYLPPAV